MITTQLFWSKTLVLFFMLSPFDPEVFALYLNDISNWDKIQL